MRVFVCGDELGLGFVVAQRLLSQGHKVMMLTSFDDLIPNLTKNGMNPVRGHIQDTFPQRQLAKADAVIDASVPSTYPLKKVYVSRLRPSLLRRALEGSGRPLIMTSSAAVLARPQALNLLKLLLWFLFQQPRLFPTVIQITSRLGFPTRHIHHSLKLRE